LRIRAKELRRMRKRKEEAYKARLKEAAEKTQQSAGAKKRSK